MRLTASLRWWLDTRGEQAVCLLDLLQHDVSKDIAQQNAGLSVNLTDPCNRLVDTVRF